LEKVLAAVADPTRRQILDGLMNGPQTAGEIATRFPQISRPAVSQHLAVLRGAGLVREERQGRYRVYHLEPEPLHRLWEGWLSHYERFWTDGLARLKQLVESDFVPDGEDPQS
jgi:DNA-binding transcriptional ArsR family regulator